MVKKTVGVKLNQEWIAEIDAYAQSKGIVRSKAIEEAIAQYFNLVPSQPEQPKPKRDENAIAKLTSAITGLTARVEAIEENIKPAKNVIKFPTGSKRSPREPDIGKQSPVKHNNQQPINKKLNAIARRAEQCGLSLEEAYEFAPWLG